jgi:membrane fusion protein (multidrug efflux system)
MPWPQHTCDRVDPAQGNAVTTRPPLVFAPWRAPAALVLALALAACGGGDKPQGGAGGPGGGMPPPAVGVVTVALRTLPIATELPGRVEALRTAQVRARVTGIVHKRLFREGSDVKAGQPLFQIDAAPYQAALDSAQAALAKAQANATQATAQATRFAPLREANAISQQDFINAQAAQKQAEADVAAARAAVQTARLNLGYATVTAPISGRIGRALVTEGALVSSVEATQLALIQQIHPVYVNFTQPMTELQRLRQSFARGAAKPVESVPVRIVTDDGGELPQAGRLLFSDLAVDATSGQVTLRAEVPNPELRLLPGLYVRGRLAQATVDNAVLLPQQAVTRGAQGDSVLVVGADGKPAPRPVQVGGSQNGEWVVTGGLKAGEQVIVDGFQKMQPGAPVKPVPWNGGAASAPATAASAPAPAASR